VGFIYCFDTCVQKRIKFVCQSKKQLVQHLRAKEKEFHLCVVCGNRYAVGMLEGIFDHLACNNVEHEAGFDLANSVGQTKMFLHAKEN
jgi:hypothetical protein